MYGRVLGIVLAVIGVFVPLVASAQGVLENPQNGSFHSGIGLISGWKCEASAISVSFDDGPPILAAYGTSREDTRAVCGDANNGYGLLFNWNLLGPGTHTVRVFADGEECGRATFTVTTLGAEFVTGASGTYQLDDFPQPGQSVTVQWQEEVQNFVIIGSTRASLPEVAGLWNDAVRFISEDCIFLNVPPDLPTALGGALQVSQDGAVLTAASGDVTFTGMVDVNGDFILTAPSEPDTADSCTFGITPSYAGNFLTELTTFTLEIDQLSGDCAGLSLPCSVSYAGSITRGTHASRTEEGVSITELQRRLASKLSTR